MRYYESTLKGGKSVYKTWKGVYEKSNSTIVCIVLLLNERSFNIIDFIAGQKAKELEASVLIGKCNCPQLWGSYSAGGWHTYTN